jgi:hypothetical protein
LLRTGVGRSHHPKPAGDLLGELRPDFQVKQFSDAKVEQLGHTFSGHQNVSRLEIPMNHLVVMRILNCLAHFHKQLDPLCGRKHVISGIAAIGSPSTYSMMK